jgi:membrane-associated phospholipid phosphatase
VQRSPSAPAERAETPARLPRGGALGQIALVVLAWVVYSMARSLSGDDVVKAVRNGRVLLNWDEALGFGWVLDLNHWVTAHGVLAVPFAFEYALLHYLLTPLVLIWLWRRSPEAYRPALAALLTMSAIGLACYVALPVAPPRLLPGAGWVDTMRAWSHVGWWGGAAGAPAGLEHITDQYAAMPSLHVGWAVWCAWAWQRSRHRLVRRLAWLYPVNIAVAVVVTANHYVMDVVGGALIAGLVCLVVPRILAWRQR